MQEVFNFHKFPSLNWNDFIESNTNRDAILYLSRWPNWEERGGIIFGDHGVGKTHLASLWAQSANAVYVLKDSFLYPARDLFDYNCNFVFDNVDSQIILENENWMFDFLNISRELKRDFLILSNDSPYKWNLKLKDLRSRINILPIVEIKNPNEDLLFKIAKKISKDLEISLSDDALKYLLSIVSRDVKSISYNLQVLDKLSLRLQKPLSMAFLKKYLSLPRANFLENNFFRN